MPVLLLLNFLTIQAWPVPLPKCAPGSFERNVADIHRVVMVGEESRSSLEEFARLERKSVAAVKQEYAATGTMVCPLPSGALNTSTVQLTGRRNLVSTVAHAFFGPQCQVLDPATCEIKFPLSDDTRTFRIRAGSKQQGRCPHDEAKDLRSDWAVFELQADVEGVTPYEIPRLGNRIEVPNDPRLQQPAVPILQVAAQSDNHNGGNGGFTFERCQIKHRDLFETASLHTNCDSGTGASGAGQLVRINRRLTLMAVHSSGTNMQPEGSRYHGWHHSNVSVPLEGEFLRTLHERVGQQSAQRQ